MTAFHKHEVGDLFASTQDERDDDHEGRVRITPAGSLWEVHSIDRYVYDDGTVCAYVLTCPATGAAITPYTPIKGEPYAHPRDEMADFIPISLPGQTWPALRLQLVALCEIKDAALQIDADLDDERQDGGPQPPTGDDYNELHQTVLNELRKAGVLPLNDDGTPR